MFLLPSPQAKSGPEQDALHHTVIYQAVAKQILTQCISAVLLVVVSYCLVGGSNIICMHAPEDDVAVIY